MTDITITLKKYTITEIYNIINDFSDNVNNIYSNILNKDIIISGKIQYIKSFYKNKYIELIDDNKKITCFCSNINIINQLDYKNEYIFKGQLLFKHNKTLNKYGFEYYINEIIQIINNEENNLNELDEYEQIKSLDKKEINWNNIKNIALLSKLNTHGYSDFMYHSNNKLNLININLYNFILEGDNTEKTLIETINKVNELNKDDLIIICRGGGNTKQISNSYDKNNIFKCIKNSKIPICSAIGHSDDKDNKLLITNITDYNFTTPTEAGLFINNIINNKILNYKQYILNILKDEYNNYLNKIKYIKKILNNDFEIININNKNIDKIIIFLNNQYYKLNIINLETININNDININININIINELNNIKHMEIFNINNDFLNNIINNKELYNYCLKLYKIYYEDINDNIILLCNLYNELNKLTDILNIYELLNKNNLLSNEFI